MDAIDQKIIEELQRNGRAPASAVSHKVNLSVPAVLERIRKLTNSGVILGYGARVDRRKLGRYLRCPVENLPSVAELQLLVPQAGANARGPQAATAPTHSLHQARDTLASTVANRRAERTALWQDSSLFQDSFFAPDTRSEGSGQSEFGTLGPGSGPRSRPSPLDEGDDIGGVVVDNPRYSMR